MIDPSNQVAKDGVIRLMAEPTSASQAPDSCLGDANEQARYLAVSATTPSATAMETAASTISFSAQTYRAKLASQLARVDQLSREKDAIDRQQGALTGLVEDRKKSVSEIQRLTEASTEGQARVDALSDKISERQRQLKGQESAKERRTHLKVNRQELAELQSAAPRVSGIYTRRLQSAPMLYPRRGRGLGNRKSSGASREDRCCQRECGELCKANQSKH